MSLKRKTLKMCRKTIGGNHRTFWMLVSEFFVRYIVCTVFEPTVYVVLDIVLNDVQSIQRVLVPETKNSVTIKVINAYYESMFPPRWQNTCLERLTHFQLVCVSPNSAITKNKYNITKGEVWLLDFKTK